MLQSSAQSSELSRSGRLTEKIQNTARVAPFVVIPGDELDEVVVESNAGLSVEDGRVVVAVQVGGDKVIFGVRKDTCKILVYGVGRRKSDAPFRAPSEASFMVFLISS
jgi:hypothetical protein